MPNSRPHTFANLAAELLRRIHLQPGVPIKMTRTNPDFIAKLDAAASAANTAQSEQAGSMVPSFLSATNYFQRVPDPTGKIKNPARSGYYLPLPDAFAFKQSQGQLRVAMEQEMIRRFRKHNEVTKMASAAKKKAKQEADRAAALVAAARPVNPKVLAATPTIHPEAIEMKTTDGSIVIKMKDSPENRKKIAKLIVS